VRTGYRVNPPGGELLLGLAEEVGSRPLPRFQGVPVDPGGHESWGHSIHLDVVVGQLDGKRFR